MSFFRSVSINNNNAPADETQAESNDARENLLNNLDAQSLCEIMQANDLKLQKQGVETPNSFPIYDFTGSDNIDDIHLSYLQTTPESNFDNEAPDEPEDSVDNARTIEVVVLNSPPSMEQVVPESRTETLPFTTKRHCINMPPHTIAKTSKALVSKEDGIALTKAEINSLEKLDGTRLTPEEIENVQKLKFKKYFMRKGVLTEAVTNERWWYEHIWVHAKPTDGYMVYVDPKDYPNIKQPSKARKYHYGEPPIEVVRYGNYRKMYDENNELYELSVHKRRGGGKPNNNNTGNKRARPTEATNTNANMMQVHNNQNQVMRFSLFNPNRVTSTNYQSNATRGPEEPNPDRWW